MLSRVADSTYWMSRYVERAENMARFVSANFTLALDTQVSSESIWDALVKTSGDQEDFAERYGETTGENVIRFLTVDEKNPNSIISCLSAARENARSVRDIIASEMWEQINTFYLTVRDVAAAPGHLDRAQEFCEAVKQSVHLFNGITDGTLTRNEAWHFIRLGRVLERADKTSRLLDVKYYILLRSVADVGTPIDEIQWAALLRSASGFEMYRQRHGRIAPGKIVQFLMLDTEFPRAVRFCLNQARESLHAITGTPPGSFRNGPERLLGQLCSELTYTQVDEIIGRGLHEYVDGLQTRLNLLGQGIHETFFALRTPGGGTRANGNNGN
jgi:uncharacterized alpha-E superfamily protein